MTTSSFKTKSSWEIAAAVTAVVNVITPVLVMIEFPGNASINALALTFGSSVAGVVEEYLTLYMIVIRMIIIVEVILVVMKVIEVLEVEFWWSK